MYKKEANWLQKLLYIFHIYTCPRCGKRYWRTDWLLCSDCIIERVLKEKQNG